MSYTASVLKLEIRAKAVLLTSDWEPSAVVGWEANSSGKLAPQLVDIGPSMDPHRLAQSAVTLNVSLMRWRAAPSLGIDRLQDLKILLLGAGTCCTL